jgi:hypothetical protein
MQMPSRNLSESNEFMRTISFPLKISKRRRTAANFSLNKDGGVFNTSNINESQQTGLKNARIDVSCHVMCFVWS